VLVACGLVGGWPTDGRAQDSTRAATVAEGNILHHPTKSLYHYRIDRDSTVHIRKGLASTDSTVSIPATTLAGIYQRVEERLLSPDWRGEYTVVGYEDNNLVLKFTQRFNLYVLVALIVVLVVGGGLLAWLWWRLSRERRRREAAAQSRRYLAEGREKERKRLAQEIHDGPVQDLHGLHMQLKALPDVPDRLQHVGEELMRVTGELRAMSADLHPPALQRFGLPAALRSHADRLTDRHPALEVDMQLDEEEAPLSDQQALSLFRIAQEAMNNAVQHGDADHLSVQLRRRAETIELAVRDDGEGFSPPEDWHTLAAADHYGLLGMKERAEAIGATLDVESTPGAGTQVRARCPLAVPDDERPEPAAPVPA
jgi:signal transduction histidine kinase